jgi:hypothetical protein
VLEVNASVLCITNKTNVCTTVTRMKENNDLLKGLKRMTSMCITAECTPSDGYDNTSDDDGYGYAASIRCAPIESIDGSRDKEHDVTTRRHGR